MTGAAVVEAGMTAAPPRPAPPAVRLPVLVQGVTLTVARRATMRRWFRRYGPVFAFHVPFFGRCVAVCDPALVRSVCTGSTEQLGNYQPNLSKAFGDGSVFALDGRCHRDRRALLAPAFHGGGLRAYETAIVEETLRESAAWPEDTEMRILEPMYRITLNVILRTILGAQPAELEQLRQRVRRFATYGSAMVKYLPVPAQRTRWFSPWSKMDEVRREIDAAMVPLIERAAADPGLGQRSDVLALLLRIRDATGAPLARQDICDELVTLIGAGHETTTSALSWAFERLRRHPDVLAELVREVDEGGADFRRATIMEVLRVRPVIDLPGRRVRGTHLDLGQWRIPHGYNVFVSLADLHENPDLFAHPERFDPARFRDSPAPGWLAFGNGARRCLGSELALHEIDTILRIVLRNFRLHTDRTPDEKPYFRGVAYAPRQGGRVVLSRRR